MSLLDLSLYLFIHFHSSNGSSSYFTSSVSFDASDSISRCDRELRSLYLLVSSILDAVEEALMDQQNDLDESAIAEMATISLNWGAFAKSVDALQRILL